MAKIGEITKRKQPSLYKQLLFMYPPPDEDKSEIEQMMRHSAYKRIGGAIRQTR